MYKVIENNKVIDVIKNPRYVRFLDRSKRSIITDYGSAQGILSSNTKEIYHLSEKEKPEGKKWKTVTLQKITDAEYNDLKLALSRGEKINIYSNALELSRKEKIFELSNECNKIILNGLDVQLSDEKYHHFAFSVEDQLNLMYIDIEISKGKERFLYHESGKECQFFSAEDMRLIIDAFMEHKHYHTIYFNMIREMINNMDDIDEISKIKYGMEIPNTYYLNKFKQLIRK